MTQRESLLRPASRQLPLALIGLLLALAVACSGSDDDATSTATGGEDNGAANPTSTAGTPEGDRGGGGGGNDAPTPIDACGLLTQDEIAETLGTEIGPGVEDQPFGPLTSCSYQDSDGFPAAQVVVIVYDDTDTARDEVDGTIQNNGYDEIANLGERAYTSIVFDVTVLQGAVELSIDLVPQTDEQLTGGMVEPAAELARIALGRLP